MLAHLVPGPLVRFFARPYVAGSSLAEALDQVVASHEDDGLLSTLDLLGESVTTPEQVERQRKTYASVLEQAAADDRLKDIRPSVSVKPSGFTCGRNHEAREPLFALAEQARSLGVPLTIDMEDRKWTDLTLDWSIELFASGLDVGTVLQTRLNRTMDDVERIPAGMRVRLVIGIYPEPAAVATTNKVEMKDRMLVAARRLLARGAKVEFATHDELYLERFAREVAPLAPERCEVQLLLGVPRERMQERLAAGDFGVALPVRLYTPFATSWDDATAYLRRRMQESPSIIWLVLRNFFHRRPRRRALPGKGSPSLPAKTHSS